jgi:alpha-ketoglutarate-dependent taurine dioxygenase
MLKIHELPSTGGDTLWASGYEVYDRLSPAFAALLEGLTATHDAEFFHDEARRLGNPLREGERGSPLNFGGELRAVHPVVRTNRKSCAGMATWFFCQKKKGILILSNSCDWLEIRLR